MTTDSTTGLHFIRTLTTCVAGGSNSRRKKRGARGRHARGEEALMLLILSPKCSAVRVVVISTLIYRWLLLVNGDFNADSELLLLFK